MCAEVADEIYGMPHHPYTFFPLIQYRVGVCSITNMKTYSLVWPESLKEQGHSCVHVEHCYGYFQWRDILANIQCVPWQRKLLSYRCQE
jgi:hypothetical protein